MLPSSASLTIMYNYNLPSSMNSCFALVIPASFIPSSDALVGDEIPFSISALTAVIAKAINGR